MKKVALFLIVALTFNLIVFAADTTKTVENTEIAHDDLEDDVAIEDTENDIFVAMDDVDFIENLARKAIEVMNEIEEAYTGVSECFKYSDIICVRELYTPTTNIILAYLFELEDNSNYSFVVMNAFSQEFMRMGNDKSPYRIYLEKNGKTELEDNQKFIYESIDCWVGTVEDDEVVIVSAYTGEVIAVEKRDNTSVDQKHIDFYTIRKQSDLSDLESRSSSDNLLARVTALPDSASLTGVGNYTQAQAGQVCIPTAITNALVYYRNTKGCTNLWSSGTAISTVAETVALYMNAMGSIYANASIPYAVWQYALSRGYTASCINIWNPTYSDIKFEISYGDCPLIGFASTTYGGGHMTTGVAYAIVSGTQTIRVFDNWSSSSQTYTFSSTENDFISALQIY